MANSSYLGTYSNDFFGDIEVMEKDGGLALALGPNKITRPMTHYDRDIFTYETFGENESIGPSGMTFTLGPDGKATQVVIEALNVAGEGTFLRTK